MTNNERIKITFHLDSKTEYSYWIPDIVEFSEESIKQDLAEHSKKSLWFAHIYSRLEAKRNALLAHIKNMTASTELAIRGEEGKLTENGIKARLQTDPELMKLNTILQEIEGELAMAKNIKDEFSFSRRETLVALGEMMRSELYNGMDIKIKE